MGDQILVLPAATGESVHREAADLERGIGLSRQVGCALHDVAALEVPGLLGGIPDVLAALAIGGLHRQLAFAVTDQS
jgi:hypothetical protein